MYLMIQSNIRGGIWHASVRYARANNKLISAMYDPTKPTNFIMEVDANNLYGWAMSQEMLDNEFEWVSQDECRNMGLLLNYADEQMAMFDTGMFDHQVNEQEKKSYILEVDLE